MRKLLLVLLLVGCRDAADVTRDSYPGLHCFGHRTEFALCVNDLSEKFVCFASGKANDSFCIRAVYDPRRPGRALPEAP